MRAQRAGIRDKRRRGGSQRDGGEEKLGGMGRRVGGRGEGTMRGARGWRGKLRAAGGEEDCGVRAAHCPCCATGSGFPDFVKMYTGGEDRR